MSGYCAKVPTKDSVVFVAGQCQVIATALCPGANLFDHHSPPSDLDATFACVFQNFVHLHDVSLDDLQLQENNRDVYTRYAQAVDLAQSVDCPVQTVDPCFAQQFMDRLPKLWIHALRNTESGATVYRDKMQSQKGIALSHARRC